MYHFNYYKQVKSSYRSAARPTDLFTLDDVVNPPVRGDVIESGPVGVAAALALRHTPGGRVADPWWARSSSRSSSLMISLMLSAEPNLFLMRWANSRGLLISPDLRV